MFIKMDDLIWKARLLSLKTRVLAAARQTMPPIDHHGEHQMLKSSQEEILQKREQLLQERDRLLQERQIKSTQLNDALEFAKSQISKRSSKMIQELWEIYPIIEFPDKRGYSICDIHLPSSEHFEGHDETMVSVAIGYVGHLLISLSDILDITLRSPIKHYGSKSLIHCTRKNKDFPLFIESFKSREWVNFSYGMDLLNLNIVQLRTLYELPTNDPDETLANLHGLRLILDNQT